MMTSNPKASLLDRAVTEIREYLFLSSYLFICFASLNYLKFAILEAQGISFAPWIISLVKALVLAKFMLLGRAFRIGESRKPLPLIVPTLRKSIAFLILLIVFTLVEEASISLIHGRPLKEALGHIAGGTLHQIMATTLIMFLILLPYFAFRSIGEAVSAGLLFRAFFERRS